MHSRNSNGYFEFDPHHASASGAQRGPGPHQYRSGSSHYGYRSWEGREKAGSEYYHDLLCDLLKFLGSPQEEVLEDLLGLVRQDVPLKQIREYLDAQLHRTLEVPPTRVDIMKIHHLCGNLAPFNVPAKPWTTVTDDDALVSHLISLYFTWDYPFYAFVDRTVFIKYMVAGDVRSDFCSPLLVNAMLASACSYRGRGSPHPSPELIDAKGKQFLFEAERHLRVHQFERGSGLRLPTLQAMLLLFERYSVLGDDVDKNHGYTMLHRAIEMAEEMGIVNGPHLDLRQWHMSDDMVASIKRTAWGLLQVDTVVHTSFLRSSRVHTVSVDRIQPMESDGNDFWRPYPLERMTPRVAFMNQYFDEACKLSLIGRDIKAPEPGSDTGTNAQDIIDDLRRWESELPESFLPEKSPAPHFILLRLRYNTLLVHLALRNSRYSSSFSNTGQSSLPRPSPAELSIASARKISSLTQLYKDKFGLQYVHPFTMYAIMLALFTMLEQPSFDILDRDFLFLTNTLSKVSRNSHAGRNLFEIFRRSAREHRSNYDDTSYTHPLSAESGTTGREALFHDIVNGLEKLTDEEDKHHHRRRSAAAVGIKDMLRTYEQMSLGEANDLQGRELSSGFQFS